MSDEAPKKIIIVEDDISWKTLFPDWLMEYPEFATAIFSSVQEFMDYVVTQDNLSATEQDAVWAFVFDNNLPEQMDLIKDGKDLIKQVKARSRYNASLVIGNSANSIFDDADENLRKNPRGHVRFVEWVQAGKRREDFVEEDYSI